MMIHRMQRPLPPCSATASLQAPEKTDTDTMNNPLSLLKTRIPFTGYRPNALYETRDGRTGVRIWRDDASGACPVLGTVNEWLREWDKAGKFENRTVESLDDIFEITLQFPEPPPGQEWHNPEQRTPAAVGVGYRLLCTSERYSPVIVEEAEPYYTKEEADEFDREPGWSKVNPSGSDSYSLYSHVTYRVPDTTPLHDAYAGLKAEAKAGRTIQFEENREGSGIWGDCKAPLRWALPPNRYRAKPVEATCYKLGDAIALYPSTAQYEITAFQHNRVVTHNGRFTPALLAKNRWKVDRHDGKGFVPCLPTDRVPTDRVPNGPVTPSTEATVDDNEATHVDGTVEGVTFAVSNNGGITGVRWTNNVHEALAYLKTQNAGGSTDYAVVAVETL